MTIKNKDFDSPGAAEAAFYFALERASLSLMMTVWEASEVVVCVHPLGPRLCGREQVEHSWRQIFAGDTPLRFRIDSVRCVQSGDLAVRQVIEHITIPGAEAGRQPQQLMLATNVYRRGESGWRLLSHHASPGPARLRPAAPGAALH